MPLRFDRRLLIAERSRRQRLAPSTRLRRESQLLDLLRVLQPVPGKAFSFPGTPPRVLPRATFDDLPASEELRRQQLIVKGRFARGNVGYVATEDIATFAAVYRRDAGALSRRARQIVGLLRTEGPLPRSELKQLSGLPGRRLSAALQEAQRAFAIVELQLETEWDNPWALFEDAFPDVDLDAVDRERAVEHVLLHYLEALAFAREQQLRDRSGMTAHDVRDGLGRLRADERFVEAEIEGDGAVLVARSAADALRNGELEPVEPYVAVLHPLDPLVLAHRTELARRFGRPDVLAWIVVDGEFAGVALGRWGILPFDVEDVELDLPEAEVEARREEVIAGLRLLYPPLEQRVLRYSGEPLDPPLEGGRSSGGTTARPDGSHR